jgi:hypothetical protein
MARVKVKPVVKETIHNEDLGGVRVTIQLHIPDPRVEVVVSLSGPCAWQGRILPQVQRFFTDETGRVVAMLPPSEEIKALTPRNPVPGLYKLQCAPIGTLTFEVPNLPEWTLGA